MKGWFLTTGKFESMLKNFLSNVHLPGETMEVVNCGDVDFEIGMGLPARLWLRGEPVTPPDYFFMIDSDGENGAMMSLAGQLEALGACSNNSLKAKKIAMSKIATYQVLAKANVPIIKTMVLHRGMNIDVLLKEIGLPMVIKPDDGYGGEGIELIHTREELEAAMSRLDRSGSRMLAQEYIATSKGTDVRVYMVGFEPLLAWQRKASSPDEFRSNVHLGGTKTPIPLTDEMRDICVRAARAADLHLLGVDLLFGKDGFVVTELNSSPGSAGVDKSFYSLVVPAMIKDIRARMNARQGHVE